jgi:hypothetical protein
MDWTPWRAHFEANAHRPLPPMPTDLELPAHAREPLIRTLAVFQRGETGEGRIANEIRRAGLPGIDDDYHRALVLFIQEEGRHALILGTALSSLGGAPRRSAWAEKVFRATRRGMDARHELGVLLAAEVVAVVFYRALAEALPPGALADALHGIVDDEQHHLAFHVDFFRANLGGAVDRASWRARWWAITTAACATVIVDHRATFKALGIDRVTLTRDVRRTIAEVDRRVLRPSLLDLQGGPVGRLTAA